MSFGKSKSESSSAPLTPEQVQGYYDQLDTNTGGNLSQFAAADFAPVQLDRAAFTPTAALTPAELSKIGGAGATRQLGLTRSRDNTFNRTRADPSLSVFQRNRSNQLTTDDFNDRSDAINKETEALLSQFLSRNREFEAGQNQFGANFSAGQNAAQFESGVTNRNLERDRLTALANIFFGGKGQVSSGKSSGFNIGYRPAPVTTSSN